jgi:phosphoglycolate phosphatase
MLVDSFESSGARSLLFDLDGTLTDPRDGILASVRYALERMGVEPPAGDLSWVIGPPLQGSLARLLNTTDDSVSWQCLSFYRERFSVIGLYENEVYAGIPAVLDELKGSGYRLFVATSKPNVYSRRILDHFNLLPYFEAVYGSELDGTRTDKGALIAHVVGEARLNSAQCLMIGDREHDVNGARVNAIGCIGALYGYGSREELEGAGASYLAASPVEIPKAVGVYFNF